jgi:uncharacterized protein (TIGR03067 family)
VQSRLARGRDRLRDRLVRRGVALSVGALALALAEKAAPAAVPAALVEGTVRAAVVTAAGAAAGAVPAGVAILTRGVLRAMLLSKLKVAGAVLVAVVVAGGTGVGARLALADKPAAAGKDAGAKDEDKILGAWTFVSGEKDGRKISEEELKELRVTFAAGGKVTPKNGEKEEEGTYKLDPTKTPKEIDISVGTKTLSGIYKTLCMGDERPTEFASTPGTRVLLGVLKRAKK